MVRSAVSVAFAFSAVLLQGREEPQHSPRFTVLRAAFRPTLLLLIARRHLLDLRLLDTFPLPRAVRLPSHRRLLRHHALPLLTHPGLWHALLFTPSEFCLFCHPDRRAAPFAARRGGIAALSLRKGSLVGTAHRSFVRLLISDR